MTDKGVITALPAEAIVLAKACAAEKKEKRTKVRSGASGETEVLAFAHSIKYARNNEQPLLDLQVLQAMLDSVEEARA